MLRGRGGGRTQVGNGWWLKLKEQGKRMTGVNGEGERIFGWEN